MTTDDGLKVLPSNVIQVYNEYDDDFIDFWGADGNYLEKTGWCSCLYQVLLCTRVKLLTCLETYDGRD